MAWKVDGTGGALCVGRDTTIGLSTVNQNTLMEYEIVNWRWENGELSDGFNDNGLLWE